MGKRIDICSGDHHNFSFSTTYVWMTLFLRSGRAPCASFRVSADACATVGLYRGSFFPDAFRLISREIVDGGRFKRRAMRRMPQPSFRLRPMVARSNTDNCVRFLRRATARFFFCIYRYVTLNAEVLLYYVELGYIHPPFWTE